MRTTARRADGSNLSTKQRAGLGKGLRATFPLEAHAELRLDGRPDPVDVLVAQGASRIPELLPVRYGRMAVDAFAFLRGSAAVMAADLAASLHTPLQVQLCGDAHVSNFGVFATPERRLVFDLNDFDETAPGPFEWDVKRLAASVEVAARMNGHSRKQRRAEVLGTVARYRTSMRAFAETDELSVWYASLEVKQILEALWGEMNSRTRKSSVAAVQKAHRKDNTDAVRKLTTRTDGRVGFAHQPPLLVPLEALVDVADPEAVRQGLHERFRAYRRSLPNDRKHLLEQFRLVDVARKVVGVGSVGTRAYVLLLLARDCDPLVLQIKEAGASVLEPYLAGLPYRSAGQRVVHGQRLMQAASDIFLGWYSAAAPDGTTTHHYVRQLRDGKGSADIVGMSPGQLAVHASLCAWTLARAHARTGDRIAIAAYLGKSATFDEAIADWAAAYADRTAEDHALLTRAIGTGRLAAVAA